MRDDDRQLQARLGRLWLVLAACALAFLARLYRLDFQSMWWDEGISLYLAGLNLGALVFHKDFALDLHPPLYHLLLAGWTTVVGPDVFSARAFSAFLGVLTVPLLYQLVARLAGDGAGACAAWLLAVSPVHVFYSQEIRMYTLVPLLAAVSLLAVVALTRAESGQQRARAGAAYVAGTALALYGYYYVAFLILAQNLFFLGWWWSHRRGMRTWLAAQLATAVLFLPWLVALVGLFTGTDLWRVDAGDFGVADPLAFLRTFWLAYSVGFAVVEPWGPWAAGLTLVVALVGVHPRGWRHSQGPALLILWLLVPVALTYLVGTQRAFVFPRFVLFSALALYGLAGAGIWRLRRGWAPAGALATAILLASAAVGLQSHYTAPRTAYASSDYLVALEGLSARAGPDDIVLCDQAWLAGYARGYLPPPQPEIQRIPPAWTSDPVLLDNEIDRLLEEAGRVWLLTWLKDGAWQLGPVEESLRRTGRPVFTDQYGEFRLRGFAAEAPPLPGRSQGEFGGALSLAEHQIDRDSLAPGESIDLVIVWRASAPVEGDYTVFAQLIGPDGRLYGQHDGPPVRGSHPTSGWGVGETVVDRRTIRLDPTAPEGDYRLIVGWYELATGRRLPSGAADHVGLATVRVGRP